ncbi:hypothetical protein [Acetobacter pasteurianus]|uniref:hypothetical protein n=1 Tax=Acetobacter pasteurianus TaxID=438 RepID=UPI0005A2132A|nr:hypothetical protein [Acetobacter pasteurianus]GCD66438.1 hypothetical protein NBRC3279_1929 [Acetobacter pasteurianus NBRC 3279]GCD72747.1 hypothetical protein NBRC3284_1903 [Acetobacter pasteurianus NBRC 3284]
MTQEQKDIISIEVGEVDTDGLRLWRTRQAVDQAKQRMEFQSTSLDTIMARATQALSWSVTVSCAFLALGAAQGFIWTLLIVGLFGAVTTICALVVLKPSGWVPPIQTPEWFLETKLSNELEITEYIARSYQTGIQENRKRITYCSRWLMASWCGFAMMPILAILVHVITKK